METKKDIQWLRNSHSLIRGNFPVFLKETLLVLEEIFLYVITNYVCVCVCVMFVCCVHVYIHTYTNKHIFLIFIHLT